MNVTSAWRVFLFETEREKVERVGKRRESCLKESILLFKKS